MKIEPARSEDYPSVLGLAAATGLSLSESSLASPAARTWVAWDQGATVGFIHALELPDEVEICDLAVRVDRRRCGVGRALLGQAAGFARSRQKAGLVLEVRPSNSAARALYAAVGFVPVAVRRRYYSDGEDALLMRLPLAPASGRAPGEESRFLPEGKAR